MGDRWCIWIDIEGFSDHYERNEAHALRMVGALLDGICRIGRRCFPDDQRRIFAHQGGDGVAIVSNFTEPDLERCASIVVALMRHVTSAGCVTRAAIAEGGAADVSTMYPACVRSGQDESGVVWLGAGLLTLTRVMGTALIRSIVTSKPSPRGPLVLIGQSLADRVPSTFPRVIVGEPGRLASIDWVRASSPMIASIQERAQLHAPGEVALVRMLQEYCARSEGLKPDWRSSVRDLLGVPV